MAHTQAINEAAPAGTDSASGGDDELRNLKRDIRERMAIDHIWQGDLSKDGQHARITAKADTELTVASGAITVTQMWHRIDTEADAAADDLDTINVSGNMGEGSFLLVAGESPGSRVVTLKDGTGNLLLNGDCALNAAEAQILLIRRGSNWREIARSFPPQTAGTPGITTSGGKVQQIAFAAAQSASGDVNTLDDYEEFTWVPELRFGGANVGMTTSSKHGEGVKIGKLVVISATITLTAKGSSTGVARIEGFPFTSGSSDDGTGYFGDLDGVTTSLVGWAGSVILSGVTTTLLRSRLSGDASMGSMDDGDFTNTTAFQWHGIFRASA